MRFRNTRNAATTAVSTAAVAVLSITLSGCGPDSGAQADPAGLPVSGGTLRLSIENEPECLDPHQSPTEAARALTRPLVDSLVRQDDGGRIRPWLATSWTISTDQLVYDFKLREGVKFTDGAPLDAAAVVANLEHVVAPETKSLLASSLLSAFESAKAVDPSTVEIRLKRPDSTLLISLATPNLGIESPATLKQDPAALCAKIVGSGPFSSPGGFVAQQGIDYVRNPDYKWSPEGAGHTGPAWLEAIKVQVAPDKTARFGALTSGQVDAITSVSPTNAKEFGALPGFTLHAKPFPGINFSYWPNTASGPLADVRVRKALRAGIDWDRIVKNVYFGVFEVAKGVISPTTPAFNTALQGEYATDKDKANKLLDQAGWTARDGEGYRTKDGKRLKLRHMWSDASITDLATQIQAGAKELGIETVEENLDGGTYVERLLSGDYDLLDTSFSASGPDVLRVLFAAENIPTAERGIANNISRYTGAQSQDLLKRALSTVEQSEQFKLYGEVQKQITEDAAVFPVYSDRVTFGARSGVKQVQFDADGSPNFYEIWLTA
ncbi:ABC transporter substrate-binding protein [Actinokineospora sp. NBRC 105648]|uniref:ABC transporter substrate-binding protein n=1 Tax=Actinokineospora sp. NBRC 105648 TaxID=3032206 RepID=UPI0024A4EFB9|nr:ABC transporter substrate-binding protein [Actinokineospora sp. NBRC 105648]GLZ40818.1 peptide ABC transporter [Actinokineospora sp. NBRC 105648]